MTAFRYVIEAETQHVSGKFATVEEIEEKLGEAIDEVEGSFEGELSGLGEEGDSEYELLSFSAVAVDLCGARRKGKPGSCALAPGHYGEHVDEKGVERWANRGRMLYAPAAVSVVPVSDTPVSDEVPE